MKIRFKHQPYRQRAVDAVVECFVGQPRREGLEYRANQRFEKLLKEYILKCYALNKKSLQAQKLRDLEHATAPIRQGIEN